MGEGECEVLVEDQPKKSRHRKKHLYNTILRQMEFYFSDANLSKDRFLSQKLSEADSIDIDVFLKFNKIRKLNCTVEDIQKAIKKSDLIGVTEDNKNIFRKVPLKVKDNVELCTIYVENIKLDATHESLTQIFSDFGNVAYVSIPKYKHNRINKGFAFIEYETEEQAQCAIAFFNSIGCKIPLDKNPEELCSIATFEGNDQCSNELEKCETESELVNENAGPSESLATNKDHAGGDINDKKRKAEFSDPNNSKKQKIDNVLCSEQVEAKESNEDTEEVKKKRKNKKDKRKNYIKDLGLQVLSKKEWKRLRNNYLDLQKKKMREFKQYLYKQKFTKNAEREHEHNEPESRQTDSDTHIKEENKKIRYLPGVIMKMKLLEPCMDVKKLKNDLKAISNEIQYVDVPLAFGSDEVYVRFGSSEAAKEFCKLDVHGEKSILTGESEKDHWQKIEADRQMKFQKSQKKVRGRDKLLKRAEQESIKHLRFDESE